MDRGDDPDELLAWAPRPATAVNPPVDLALPGYRDFRLVAQGGEGSVYRARQEGLDRDVAIKVLQAVDAGTLARFRRELEITVRLGRQHPHIVTVLATGTVAGGRPCIVMEFHDLGSLHDKLRDHGPLPVAEVVAAGTAVADALAFAHAQGFLHRDVKPQNILLLPTSYVLTDFGIARGADAGHSASLQLMSYRHAAPQMLDGAAPAAADDQWSLGSTLFTLLTGHAPFASDNPGEDTVLPYLARVRAGAQRPLARGDVPAELRAVIARCLSPRREDRYPDTAALRDALAAIRTEPRNWIVDPEATAMAPGAPTPAIDSSPADFGPRPEPPAPEPDDATAEAPPSPGESRPSMTGALADLTVRHEPPAPPDFGPSAAGVLPVAPAPEPPPETTQSLESPPAPAHQPHPAPPTGGTAIDWDSAWRQPPGPGDPSETAPTRNGSRRAALVAACLAAVAVGVTIGVLNGRRDTPPADAAASTTVSSSSTTISSISTTIVRSQSSGPTGGDPAFSPTLTRLVDTGAAIDITWTDPTEGQAQFVLLDVTDPAATPRSIATIAAGATTHTVTGLDESAPRYCYQVIAIGLVSPETDRGASTRVCSERN
ncbi:serine/threonine-protein kinase [Actinokineospora pegani]|uniref:serine/threonine-protein kinase n=1 Tax=Actinokineospora pegani TaxID=2654637 RepID=UPI0018D3F368|nr:protein kinase [Actinokineospora pegani]